MNAAMIGTILNIMTLLFPLNKRSVAARDNVRRCARVLLRKQEKSGVHEPP